MRMMNNREERKNREQSRQNYRQALYSGGLYTMRCDDMAFDYGSAYYNSQQMDANDIVSIEAEVSEHYFRHVKPFSRTNHAY